ncbi:IclR family transcriptional regulator domain-containing protein [Shumkonia mesophila]|uniref:IclR family transcriptional regulator domain-containing protein n=1 Tax=Shumkonia mesophila TaxID=2838854 RepID=UPI002934A50D|nr:IclR family transcriptional regulator C-terminal domain-containing protein [Shumkonia mesophila]
MDSTDPAKSKQYLQSLAHGLAVIVAMGKSDTTSIPELAERLGMNRWLVRRVILTIEALGYVERSGRRLRLLPKVLDLGYAFLSSMELWKIADPLIVDLVEKVRLSCTMSVLEGHDIVYIARHTASHRIVSIPLQVGSRIPAHCTASGRVLLSDKAIDALRDWLSHAPLPKMTPLTVTDPTVLEERILETRRSGWCRVDHELAEGSCAIALPVRDRLGRVMAAISLSGRDEDLKMPAVLDELQETAHRIESVIHRR